MADRLKKHLSLLLFTGMAWFSAASVAYASIQEISLSGNERQCSANGVNDSGAVVGTCTTSTGNSEAFVALTPTGEQALQPLVPGRNCSAARITDNGTMFGTCEDSNATSQAVEWLNPGSTPTQLPALLGGVASGITAINEQDIAVGVSSNNDTTNLPVIWLTPTTATPLPVGLLGLGSTNCSPSDVNDTSATVKPVVVGNCPNGGTAIPVKWTWTSGLLGGAYSAARLTVPVGAKCAASGVNRLGHVLGICETTSGPVTVRWPADGSAPAILTTVGSATLPNFPIGMNANGDVTGSYTTAGGFVQSFIWTPSAGSNATPIAPLSGGKRISVSGIGDNGIVVGTSEGSDGDSHAIAWTSTTGSVDQGSLGGPNTGMNGIATGGCYGIGNGEESNETSRAFLIPLCTSAVAATVRQTTMTKHGSSIIKTR